MRLLSILAICFSSAAILHATTYNVKTTGSDANTCVQAQSPSTPKLTIAGGAGCLANGDTLVVFAGSYAEHPTIAAGGSGAVKTITVNGTDAVTVQGFTLGNFVSIIGNCPTGSAIGTGGCFSVTNPSSPTTACVSFASNDVVQGNVFYACGTFGMGTSVNSVVKGNTVSYIDSTNVAPINIGPWIQMNSGSGSLLIDGNDVSHVSDFIHFQGSHHVIRNNHFHDVAGSTDMQNCPNSPNAGNCHVDYIEAEPGGGENSVDNLYENNTENNIVGVGGSHGFLIQGDSCTAAGVTCAHTIIRFNQEVHVGGAIVGNDVAGYNRIHTYNNTSADALTGAQNGGEQEIYRNGNQTTAASKNNIYHFVGAITNTNAISVPSLTGFQGNNNLAWCTGTPCSPYSYVSSSGTWLGTPSQNNKLQDPLFVGYSSTGLGDLHLQATSPASGAGSYLTTTSNAGSSSTSLTVADADYFQDGFGQTGVGVQPDWIRIGPSTTVQIAAGGINYATGAITLASAVSWGNGDPVYLYKDSGATLRITAANGLPDMGALGLSSSLTCSPSSLNFGSQATGTTSGALSSTCTNTSAGAITGLNTGVSIIGSNLGDFAQSNTCPASLAAAANCVLSATFTPSATGSRSANIQLVYSGGTGSPLLLGLSGTGVTAGPITSYSPSTLSFGNQNTGTSSAAKTITLTNTGNASLTITTIAMVTGTNYSLTTTPPGCVGGCTVAANGTVTISVVFAPTLAGSLTDTVRVTSNAPSSPDNLSVSGTGVCATCVNMLQHVDCGPSNFANPGGGSCTISATTSGSLLAAAIGGYNACGTTTTISSIADNKTDTWAQVSGARSTNSSGATSFSDIWYAANVAAGVTSVTITPSATCRMDVELYEFSNVNAVDTAGNVNSGASTTTPSGGAVTTTGTSEAVVAILHPVPASTPTGIHAGNVFTSDSLNDGMAWAHYIPTVAGTYTPQWDINPAGTFGASTAAFTQSAGGAPAVSLSVTGLSFGGLQPLQTNSSALTVQLTNTGTATLTITSIAPSGGNAADFTITANACGATLVESASCNVTVQFKPGAQGNRSSTLVFTTNASTSPDNVSLSGTAILQPTSFGGAAARGIH